MISSETIETKKSKKICIESDVYSKEWEVEAYRSANPSISVLWGTISLQDVIGPEEWDQQDLGAHPREGHSPAYQRFPSVPLPWVFPFFSPRDLLSITPPLLLPASPRPSLVSFYSWSGPSRRLQSTCHLSRYGTSEKVADRFVMLCNSRDKDAAVSLSFWPLQSLSPRLVSLLSLVTRFDSIQFGFRKTYSISSSQFFSSLRVLQNCRSVVYALSDSTHLPSITVVRISLSPSYPFHTRK